MRSLASAFPYKKAERGFSIVGMGEPGRTVVKMASAGLFSHGGKLKEASGTGSQNG